MLSLPDLFPTDRNDKPPPFCGVQATDVTGAASVVQGYNVAQEKCFIGSNLESGAKEVKETIVYAGPASLWGPLNWFSVRKSAGCDSVHPQPTSACSQGALPPESALVHGP